MILKTGKGGSNFIALFMDDRMCMLTANIVSLFTKC